MLVVSHGTNASSVARVFDHVRRGGAVLREDLVSAVGLSPATVSRAIADLSRAGLVRARPEMGRVGAVGRPSIPVQLETRAHGVIGVHLGRRWTTVALADLRGHVLEHVDFPNSESIRQTIERVCETVEHLASSAAGRILVSAGVVSPWIDLKNSREQILERVGEALGVPVLDADHITAAAAAEHGLAGQGSIGTTAYVYARDTIGFAIAEGSADQTTVTRARMLTHFPTGSAYPCRCRSMGCLEATASDNAIALRAHAEGLIAEPDIQGVHAAARAGSPRAQEILRDRARVLGRAVAFVGDMLDCDQIVVIGQGFTSYVPARRHAIEGFEQTTSRSPLTLRFGNLGTELQAVAACSVALVPFCDDPLGFAAHSAR